MRATQMSGQLARRYNLPMRASNACAANAPDAQAAWESAFSRTQRIARSSSMIQTSGCLFMAFSLSGAKS